MPGATENASPSACPGPWYGSCPRLTTLTRDSGVRANACTACGGGRRSPEEHNGEERRPIRRDGVQVSTTMRTPGNDYELAVGFCHTEGVLGDARVTGVRYCADGSAV